ncbi:hypothetical protein O9992_06795 [Vibrio lentus]|nr:hypothetical protein [Vibrio lentus]
MADPTLEDMFSVYNNERSQYWVIELDGKVVGGGGLHRLAGTCQKSVNCKRCTSCRNQRQGLAEEVSQYVDGES